MHRVINRQLKFVQDIASRRDVSALFEIRTDQLDIRFTSEVPWNILDVSAVSLVILVA
jgi:hypothetical protein